MSCPDAGTASQPSVPRRVAKREKSQLTRCVCVATWQRRVWTDLVRMAASCRLRAVSKPIVLRSQPGAVVEDVWIRVSTSGVAALRCIDSPGVLLRRLRIEHAHDGVGIKFERCDRIRIEDVAIRALDASP